jgi:hypothetical protein
VCVCARARARVCVCMCVCKVACMWVNGRMNMCGAVCVCVCVCVCYGGVGGRGLLNVWSGVGECASGKGCVRTPCVGWGGRSEVYDNVCLCNVSVGLIRDIADSVCGEGEECKLGWRPCAT